MKQIIKLVKWLPIKWQRKVRSWAQAFEFATIELVIPDPDVRLLIENTYTPDFVEYFKRVDAMEARWGYDSELQSLKVFGRFRQFQKTNLVAKQANADTILP